MQTQKLTQMNLNRKGIHWEDQVIHMITRKAADQAQKTEVTSFQSWARKEARGFTLPVFCRTLLPCPPPDMVFLSPETLI